MLGPLGLRIYDISVQIRPDMPVWPGSVAPRLERALSLARGDPANVSHLTLDVHTGTHVDAPLHSLVDGAGVDRLDLGDLIGICHVIHLLHVDPITADDLEGQALPRDLRRLLIRTVNSEQWTRRATRFITDFVALTADAARWIVDRGVRLVGVDYLSVQRFQDPTPETHLVLLRAGVVLLEGANLAAVPPGTYELICLPLNLAGSEGAPARAILRALP